MPQGMTTSSIITVAGELNTDDVPPIYETGTFLDALIIAQRELGQITWDDLSETVAQGSYIIRKAKGGAEYLDTRRVVVIDLDNATAREALDATQKLFA